MAKKPLLKVLTLAEISKLAAAEERKLRKQIAIDPKNAVCTITITYPYEVDLDRIRTERDLLRWAYHLSGKVWMHREHIKYFIAKVAEFKGFDLNPCRPAPDHTHN